MRVLMLTTNSSLMDGINRHILAISGGLCREGVEVGVCIVHPRGELANELEKVGARVFSLDCINGHSLKILPRFWKVMREFKPDVVHVHVLSLVERVMLSWAFSRVKKVVTIHGIVDPVERKTLKMKAEEVLTKMTPIPYARQLFISNGVRKAIGDEHEGDATIYNPIDIRAMAPRKLLRELIGVAPETKVVGTACRIDYVKNPMAFARVMGEITERLNNMHGVIIGDGVPEIMAELRAYVAEHPRVHLLGYRADARQLISECDCFVMTSAREGMPTALLEAMSGGVTVAFWKGEGGLVDLAELNEKEGPFGVVVEQGDVEGLASDICRVEREGRIEMGTKAREVVARHFSLNEVANLLKEAYER